MASLFWNCSSARGITLQAQALLDRSEPAFATRRRNELFYSTSLATLRAQYPDNPVLQNLSDETRLVVSEPLGDFAGAWNEVPESDYGIIQQGQDELKTFTPRVP
jgi:glutamine amidotransferase